MGIRGKINENVSISGKKLIMKKLQFVHKLYLTRLSEYGILYGYEKQRRVSALTLARVSDYG